MTKIKLKNTLGILLSALIVTTNASGESKQETFKQAILFLANGDSQTGNSENRFAFSGDCSFTVTFKEVLPSHYPPELHETFETEAKHDFSKVIWKSAQISSQGMRNSLIANCSGDCVSITRKFTLQPQKVENRTNMNLTFKPSVARAKVAINDLMTVCPGASGTKY